ncbi:glutathione S-transferase, partial [Pilaira anomala]
MSLLKNVKLYYYVAIKGNPALGRGEHIRLLLEDAGVNYEYVRYTHEQWKEEKQKFLAQKVPEPTIPYMTIDGKYYSKTMPLMRLLSRKLNLYNGENEDEVYMLDYYMDMINDWLHRWGYVTFINPTEEETKTYKEKTCPETFKTWENILSEKKGPFLFDERISYVDFVLFHMLEDDANDKVCNETYPHLFKFVEAITNRPNLKKYLATDRK